MTFLFSIKPLFAMTGLALLLGVSGCATIAGPEDAEQDAAPALNIRFVETLRNEDSLLGESFRELTDGKNADSALFQRPGSVYADRFRVYVTDTVAPGKVFVFDRGKRKAFELNITTPPSADNDARLLAPSGIAVDATGVIFVSDAQQGRVYGYDRNGALLLLLGRGQVLTPGTGLGDLSSPAGLAVDNARNRLYVADIYAQKIKVFSNAGFHLFDIGNAGKPGDNFKFPIAVAVDAAGTLYVVDSLRSRVYLFDPDGNFLRGFSMRDAGPGMSIKPKGIAVDSEGHIYVADAVNSSVLVFNNDGSLALNWGRTGRLIGEFWTPTDIFIDDQDYIYIADQTNSRVQVFQYIK